MPPSPLPSEVICFGDFQLDRRSLQLRYRGDERRLRAKSLSVLRCLAENPDRLISHAEILHAVWPDTTVSQTVLRVCIREIRVALAEEADRFLTTVPRRGYRFTGAEVAVVPPATNTTERRQLTVMCCDLGSPIHLAQSLDPEDLRRVVRAYQDLVSEVVLLHGGHIAQYLANGLVVYFGYPKANEDDAQRSIRAGLDLLSKMGELNAELQLASGIQLASRIGIHTGLVVIGDIGSSDKTEPLALGNVPHIAAAVQSAVEPGQVVVTDATSRLVTGMFVMEDGGSPVLEGMDEPLPLHRVVRPSGVRGRIAATPGHPTPFVGRESEVAELTEHWEAARKGTGRCVLLSGEAGIGKSRIVYQMRAHLAGSAHTWMESGATPYSTGTSFHPVVTLVAQGLGFAWEDSTATKLDKIERGLGTLASRENVTLAAELLGLPPATSLRFSPELRRQKTIDLLVEWLRRISTDEPAVVVVEDLHWCDPSTLELLVQVTAQLPATRILLLTNARPEFTAPWPAGDHCSTIEIKRLSPGETRTMAMSFASSGLRETTLDTLMTRSDGVPLFVEELAKSITDSAGVAAAEAIPATLADSLMGRLDRLKGAKKVAQVASVLGREFDYRLLAEVSDLTEDTLRRELQHLVEAGLLFVHGDPPEATFAFKHALIQETAYQSQLKRTRQQEHGRVAAALEERSGELLPVQSELVARHYDEAGEPAKAIAYYQRAGEEAADKSANEESMSHLRRALALIEDLPEDRERQQRELALLMAIATPLSAAHGWSNPEYEGIFRRARELATAIDAAPDLPRVIEGMAAAVLMKGDVATSLEIANEVLAIAEQTGDSFDLLIGHVSVGTPLLFQGNFRAALEHLEQGIALYHPDDHPAFGYLVGFDRGVAAHAYAGLCLVYLGETDRALKMSERSIALARHLDHPLTLANVLFEAAIVRFERREFGAMRKHLSELINVADEFGFPFWLSAAKLFEGAARVEAGERDEGIAEIQQAADALAQIGNGLGAPPVLFVFADSLIKAGRRDEALLVIELGLGQAAELNQHLADAELFRLRAEILLDADPRATSEPETLLLRALEIATKQGAKLFALRAAIRLARLWQQQDNARAAQDLLAPRRALIDQGQALQDFEQATTLLEELRLAAPAAEGTVIDRTTLSCCRRPKGCNALKKRIKPARVPIEQKDSVRSIHRVCGAEASHFGEVVVDLGSDISSGKST